MVQAGEYVRLEAAAGDVHSVNKLSTVRRMIIMTSAVAACLLGAGLAFGFSGLFPALVSSGAFRDQCEPGDPVPCYNQVASLTGMFTVATSALNMFCLPGGAALDHFGPRLTAAISCVTCALGCGLFSLRGPGAFGHAAYYSGFLILAVSGPIMFTTTLSFPNLFPGREGVMTASLVGSFDASSAIFVVLASIMAAGVSFSTTFLGYAVVPFAVAGVAFLFWPNKVVDREIVVTTGSLDDGPLPPPSSPLIGLTARQQVCTAEFWLFANTVSVQMVCINFFIATVFTQVAAVRPDQAYHLSGVFATMLAAGGIVYIPVIGAIADNLGATVGLVILWVAYLVFSVLMDIFRGTGSLYIAYAAFAVFAFVRPFFYSLGALFCGEIFGYDTFGTVYGSVTTIAGIFNMSVSVLSVLAAHYGYAVTSVVLLATQLTTVALPGLVLWRARNRPTNKSCRRRITV